MFVSTNVLTLMQRVPAYPLAPEMKTALHPGNRGCGGLFVRVMLAHKRLNLLCQQLADGGRALCCKHLRLLNRLCAEADRHVLLLGLRHTALPRKHVLHVYTWNRGGGHPSSKLEPNKGDPRR